MKHWPSFEPFGEASESARFLALWPSVMADEPEAETNPPVSIEPSLSVGEIANSPVPPTVDPVDKTVRSSRAAARFSPLLLLLSLAVHATALALTAHFLTQPGVEAETDAISVEIVVDATPNANTDPSLAGAAAASEADKAKDTAQQARTEATPQGRAEQAASPVEKPRETEKPAPDVTPAATPETRTEDDAIVVPPPALALPTTPPDIKVPPRADALAAATATEVPSPTLVLPPSPPPVEVPVLASPQAAEAQVPEPALVLPEAPPKVEVERPAPMTLEMVTQAVPAPALTLAGAPPPIADGVEPHLALPEEAPPPTPAPEKTKPAAKAETAAPVVGSAKAAQEHETKSAARHEPDQHEAARVPKQDHRAPSRSSSSGVGDASGRGSVASHGGANAGEKAAYAARLNSHVRRFERYPAEAERSGVTGSARLLITIDRGGRLIALRLAGSSGSAILDDAAKATASRASPYPPPPDGVGGRTLTFAATIRFRRQ